MKNKLFRILPSHSRIDWIGRKVTGAHYGTIEMKEGTLVFTDDKLTGGNFVVDTTSIKILDVIDPDTNAQFAGHLASADFFAAEQYPEALFEINSAEQTGNNNYRINGDLTIRGIKHPVTFDATVNVDADEVTASGKITVDRTLYGMKFRSGNFFKDLGDVLIYNDFYLDINITAKTIHRIYEAKHEEIN